MTELSPWWHHLHPIYQSFLVLAAGLLVYLLGRYVVIRRLGRLARATTNDLDDRLVYFARQFVGIVILFVVVALVLKVNGVKVSPLLAGAGIVGVSLGFAAKETIADILAGIFLIADQPIRIGDRIKIDKIGSHWGGWGDVVDIGLRRTRIRNTDGVFINYPNASLANSVITNFSYENKPTRVRIRFEVDYDADFELTKRVVSEAINACPGVIPDTAQTILRSVDDSQGRQLTGVLMESRYMIKDVRMRTLVRSDVLQHVLENLRRHNIPIATAIVRLENERHWQKMYGADEAN